MSPAETLQINFKTTELFLNISEFLPPTDPHPSHSMEAFSWFKKQMELENSHPLIPYIQRALELHDKFNQNTPHPDSSYHNGYHIMAVMIAAHKAFEQAGKNNDPLRLCEDLEIYNSDHGTHLDLDDLYFGFLIATAGHDLGDDIENFYMLSGNPVLAPRMLFDKNIYNGGTEAESSAIIPILAEKYIDKSKLEPKTISKLEDILKLSQYLVLNTTFQVEKESEKLPFAVSMRFLTKLGKQSTTFWA